RRVLGGEVHAEAVRGCSLAGMRAGRITALADLYRGEGGDAPATTLREGSLEAIDAAAPRARADVALCLAALLEGLRGLGIAALDLDNHPTDPHTAPLLATLEREEIDPVQLVEIPSGLTATLRELP